MTLMNAANGKYSVHLFVRSFFCWLLLFGLIDVDSWTTPTTDCPIETTNHLNHHNQQRKLNAMRTKPTIALMVGFLTVFSGSGCSEESTGQPQLEASETDVSGVSPEEQELVQVDWIEELTNGGITMIAIGVLSVLGVALALERLVAVSRKRIVPPEVMKNLNAYLKGGDGANLYQCCKERTDPLSQTTSFVLENWNEPCEFVRSGAGDIASRSIRNHL